jgi:hypothetical protein
VLVQASIRTAQKERASIEIASSGRIDCLFALLLRDSTLKVVLAQAMEFDSPTVPMSQIALSSDRFQNLSGAIA